MKIRNNAQYAKEISGIKNCKILINNDLYLL